MEITRFVIESFDDVYGQSQTPSLLYNPSWNTSVSLYFPSRCPMGKNYQVPIPVTPNVNPLTPPS